MEDGDENQWSEDSDTEEAQDQKVGQHFFLLFGRNEMTLFATEIFTLDLEGFSDLWSPL